MKILNAIDARKTNPLMVSDFENGTVLTIRGQLVEKALPALLRLARAIEALDGADLDPDYGPDAEIINARQQLRDLEVGD